MNRVLLITFLCITFFVDSTFATEFHVSTSGNDSNDGTIQNPWRHPEYAAKQLKGGDTLYIHAGTYLIEPSNVPGLLARYAPMISPPMKLNNDADHPILITNYKNDAVYLDGTISPPYPVIGSGLHTNYVTINGFKVRGALTFMWVDYCTVKNCNIFGGIDCPVKNNGDNFGCVIRIEGGRGCLIRNNMLHDNQVGINLLNSPLIMEYDSSDLIIENNEIYNSVSVGIRLKDNPENVIVRFNYIHDNYYSGLSGGNQDQGHNITIYQNIFKNNNKSNDMSYGAITTVIYIKGWKIYNNTFINNGYADIRGYGTTGVGDIQSWNNIMYRENGGYFYSLGWSSTGPTFAGHWTYSDFNNFYSPSNSSQWKEWLKTWQSLSDFSTGNGQNFDKNSSDTNPFFINPKGIRAEDYKLMLSSPCRTSGRSAPYATAQGAYITGSEIIGTYLSAPKAFKLETP